MFSINSGIDGLNEMLNGGMPDKSITALVGPAGSGKTILHFRSCMPIYWMEENVFT